MQTTDAPISVTDKAARKIAQLADEGGPRRADPSPARRGRRLLGVLLRARIRRCRCPTTSSSSAVDGVRVVVDPQSAEIVEGSTLDIDTSMLGGGLKVHNPRAVHECACGESFSI